jgi:bifunctional oligoribonuclease and PAP phosphatase NrnA
MTDKLLNLISRKIMESRKIGVVSHLRPDGDSICTSLALYFMCKQLNKDISVCIKDDIPIPFNDFPDIDVIQIGPIQKNAYDSIILLECANVSRSGQKNLDDYFKINIDHHHSNDYYADINWVEPNAAAVACMVYKLGKKLNIHFTKRIATQLYSAIVSDTGSFQFSNTQSEAFKTCHELVKHGAVPIEVSDMLFNNNPPEKIKLLGKVLSTLQMTPEGNIAVITMLQDHLRSLNLKHIDTEDITTCARSIRGIKVVLFFKEMEENTFRVSVRSKENANSAEIAEYFGGGGHLHAAGFTVKGPYSELINQIPKTVNDILVNSDACG